MSLCNLQADIHSVTNAVHSPIKLNSHFLATGRNCYNTVKLILFSQNIGKTLHFLEVSNAVPAKSCKVTVAFNFIIEHCCSCQVFIDHKKTFFLTTAKKKSTY